MEYKKIEELKNIFLEIINGYILNKEKTNDVIYNNKKLEELKEYVDMNNENFIYDNFEDVIMFLETAFNFDILNDDEYESVFKKIKEVQLNFFARKLSATNKESEIFKEFIIGDISKIKKGIVFYFNDEIYLAKNSPIKTSRGYQITTTLVFENNYNFANNIYIELNNKSFIIIGMLN